MAGREANIAVLPAALKEGAPWGNHGFAHV
jgi:hypothetical protein